ncbi:UPF0158 family protein [Metallumcola ferriviriculae]|uniref:UPF0158 family protein n=1 Tax=Metallumcola ferriviriculae TaxID=3039180 RepID=A0AAU0UR79_9FIRM|nr:UPF0158 family protein [Desulfitibacteraceae bacterium MK1]
MSDIHKEYGKKLRAFNFDGSHPSQDAILINGNFIIYEKGLLIKGLPPLNQVYTKWRDMSGVTLYEGETTKVTIALENEDGKIVAESKDRPKDVIAFYDLIEVQREKYRYYDELKQLKVDLVDISIIMDTDRWENHAYLDTEIGEIIHIPIELDEDNVYDEEYVAGLPQWEREMVEKVKKVYENEEGRYEVIPERASYEAYDTMVEFTKRLDDLKVSEKLFDALDGKGAFRRFENVISRYPEIEKQWYKYKTEIEKQEVREWLWSIGLEPVER